jgi:hypothetical protein
LFRSNNQAITASAIARRIPSGTPTYIPIFESDLPETVAAGSDVAGGVVEMLVEMLVMVVPVADEGWSEVLEAVDTKSASAAVV